MNRGELNVYCMQWSTLRGGLIRKEQCWPKNWPTVACYLPLVHARLLNDRNVPIERCNVFFFETKTENRLTVWSIFAVYCRPAVLGLKHQHMFCRCDAQGCLILPIHWAALSAQPTASKTVIKAIGLCCSLRRIDILQRKKYDHHQQSENCTMWANCYCAISLWSINQVQIAACLICSACRFNEPIFGLTWDSCICIAHLRDLKIRCRSLCNLINIISHLISQLMRLLPTWHSLIGANDDQRPIDCTAIIQIHPRTPKSDNNQQNKNLNRFYSQTKRNNPKWKQKKQEHNINTPRSRRGNTQNAWKKKPTNQSES